MGPDELLVALKAEFDPDPDMTGLANAINATEVRLRVAVPIAQVIDIEPDLIHGEVSK